ncbi:MAG TPA: ACP S-malonyltransferase [Candidatus Deferrimicrobium sp.]|nr:ACP S-malonyltransferase [Candidatus Deferrimicrobium sp.]
MSRTALFFPGQGAQYVGMARDLYDADPAVKELYELASDELSADIAAISFDGPADELRKTQFTQPAILLHSLAILCALRDRRPEFDFVAGHSLGEYSALAAAGSLSFEDAVRAVVKRATLMEEACRRHPSNMAAIIGLDATKVEEICTAASGSGTVVPANYNAANQVVIAGELDAVEEAMSLARAVGARRAIMLEVGGAFHSPLMESAQTELESYLDQVTFHAPSRPLIANVTAQPVVAPNDIRRLLVQQVTAPVKWWQTMTYLARESVTTVIEIGPGTVLTGLARRDMKLERIINLGTLAAVEAFEAVPA